MWLFCVRHGQSVHNAEGRMQGRADSPLSDLGRRQSRAVADVLAKMRIDAIYSSPLQRALETARITADRLRLTIRVDPRLQEIDIGIFQGRLRTEAATLYPEIFARWAANEPDYAIPGGESRHELQDRGVAALRDIALSGFERVAVFSHGRLLAVTLAALVPISGDAGRSALENASISVLRAASPAAWTLVAHNRVDHLSPESLSGAGDL